MAAEDRAPINWTTLASRAFIVLEMLAIVALLTAVGYYLWNNTTLGTSDISIQVASLAGFVLAGALWVNRTISKRW